MSANTYGRKVKIATYITNEVYQKLEEERGKTGESQSGIIASILECFVEEASKENMSAN